MGKIELKPCPFCGATQITPRNPSGLFLKEEDFGWVVMCTVCGVSTGMENRTDTEAIEAWNRRANDEG